MTLKADWEVVGSPIDPDSNERLFFTDHEWDTVEAATARIIPTDHDPGAREARVIVFIDRYLSGIDYIFAAADGSGFLKLTGKFADAWRARMHDMQQTYRDGIWQLDLLARQGFGREFKELDEAEQDRVLENLSGASKPVAVTLGKSEAVGTFLQGVFDEGLPFFDALNRFHPGWKVLGRQVFGSTPG